MIVPEHAEDDAAVVAVERRLPASVEFLLVRDHVFERLAPSTTHNRCWRSSLALLPPCPPHRRSCWFSRASSDPGNLGTLVRAADAVAAGGGGRRWRRP